MQMAYIGTTNVRENRLNTILGDDTETIDNIQNTSQIGVTGYG